MGVGDALEKSKILSNKSADAVRTAESIIGGVASMFSYVGAAEGVLQAIGILASKEDVYLNKLNEISDKLDDIAKDLELDSALLAKTFKMFQITNLNGALCTSMMDFQHYIDNPLDPKYPVTKFFDVPFTIANTLLANTLIEDAIEDAIEGAYWQSFYVEALVFNDSWTGKLAPPDVSGRLVWDYRVTLSAYLGAISLRVIMLQALEPNFRTNELYCAEIKSYSENLLAIHNKIVQDGIVGIRIPEFHEFILSYVDNNKYPYITHFYHKSLEEKTWKGHNYIYGLVERYSGLSHIQSFQPIALELSRAPKISVKMQEYGAKYPSYFLSPISYEPAEFKVGDLDYLVAMNMLGFSIVSQIEPYFHDLHPINSIYEYYTNIFLPKYFVRLAKLWQDFYSELGMLELWRTINHLRTLAGESPLDTPNCTCLSNLIPSMECSLCIWLSLRNVYDLIVRSLEAGESMQYINDPPFYSPDHQITMLELASKLRIKSPITLRRIYED